MEGKTVAEGDPAARLIEKLRSLRSSMEDDAGDARRLELDAELRAQLSGLAPPERLAVVERALASLRPGDAGEGAGAAADLRAARAERQTLRAEVEKLGRENAKLRAERGVLQAELGEAKKGRGGGPSGRNVAAIREGLRLTLESKKVDPESLGLDPNAVRLFRLVQELVQFVYNLEFGRVTYLNEIESGYGRMDSVLIRQRQEQVRHTIRKILDDEEGSVAALTKILQALNKFVVGLTDAFHAALPAGTKALLDQLEPEIFTAEAKGRLMGIDYEKAFSAFSTRRSDLSNQTAEELFALYFRDPFRERLATWAKEG